MPEQVTIRNASQICHNKAKMYNEWRDMALKEENGIMTNRNAIAILEQMHDLAVIMATVADSVPK